MLKTEQFLQAWFRELPRGVLDSLSPEQVMQCNSEDEAVALVKTLPPMQRALLDWGINLMADVVQEEPFNKMNAHNIAMVFAPNMTQVDGIVLSQSRHTFKCFLIFYAWEGKTLYFSLFAKNCPRILVISPDAVQL